MRIKHPRRAIALAMAGGILAGTVATVGGSAIADAASARLQTVTQAETIVSPNCYRTYRDTYTYYAHSSAANGHTGAWLPYPAPKHTVTVSEHCLAP